MPEVRALSAALAVTALLAGCGAGGHGPVVAAAQSALPAATVDERPDGPSVPCAGLDRALAGAGAAKAGKKLPTISLSCLGGGPAVSLAGLRGPAVLNIWASWCGPCGDEAPYLVDAEHSLAGRVRFVGLDVSDEPADARAWNNYHGVGWPSLRDPHGVVRGPLHVPGPPVTFFLRSDGTIAGVHYGAFTSADEVRRAVETKLGVRGAAPAKGIG
ncbi:MAG TPA: TlpA disulfide reductase family protein [Sporichthyaceae bacterium]|jgi:thiol-disulfide isomerase/thioredoxin